MQGPRGDTQLSYARCYLSPLSGIPESSVDSDRWIGLDPLESIDRSGVLTGSFDSTQSIGHRTCDEQEYVLAGMVRKDT